jgi:hypothetical protein
LELCIVPVICYAQIYTHSTLLSVFPALFWDTGNGIGPGYNLPGYYLPGYYLPGYYLSDYYLLVTTWQNRQANKYRDAVVHLRRTHSPDWGGEEISVFGVQL